MNDHPTSTIAALCYAKPSGLDFRSLVDELGQALSDHEGITCKQMSKYEDFVVFDLTTVASASPTPISSAISRIFPKPSAMPRR